MMSRKTIQSGKPSHDLAFEQAQAGMSTRAVRFQAATLPPIGTPQHAALVSDLRRAFPEIYAPREASSDGKCS
jgi:hypothetical protein